MATLYVDFNTGGRGSLWGGKVRHLRIVLETYGIV